jgi:hypothetical protein
MKELIEIFRVVKSGRITRPEKINPFDIHKEPISHKFYNGLMAKHYASDQDAREALYGKKTGESSGKDILKKYNMLKQRMKQRVFTTVLFPAEGRYPANGYASTFIYCYRNFTIGRLLLFFGAHISGRVILKKVLTRALESEIHDVALLSVMALRREMVVKGDPKEFNKIKRLTKELQEKLAAELALEEIYYDLELPFATKLYISPDIVEAAAVGLKEADQISKSFPIFRIQSLYRDIKIFDCQVRGALIDATAACDDAIAALESNIKMYSKARHGSLLLRKMDSILLLNKIDMAYDCAEQCLDIFLQGTNNWFLVKELLFLVQINDSSHGLEHAIITYFNSIKQPEFKDLELPEQEKWQIYGGYLWLMLTYHNKLSEREAIFGKRKGFDIATLSKNITVTWKDKKGVYVSFIILKALIYCQEKKTRGIETSKENLKNYLSTNLRGDNNRGRNFIRLLMALIENEGRLKIHASHIKKLARALKRTEHTITATQLQIEVISYLKLWKIAEDIIMNRM